MHSIEKQKEFFNQKVMNLALTKMQWGRLMTKDFKPHPDSGLSQEEMEQAFAQLLTHFANLLHARKQRYEYRIKKKASK